MIMTERRALTAILIKNTFGSKKITKRLGSTRPVIPNRGAAAHKGALRRF